MGTNGTVIPRKWVIAL